MSVDDDVLAGHLQELRRGTIVVACLSRCGPRATATRCSTRSPARLRRRRQHALPAAAPPREAGPAGREWNTEESRPRKFYRTSNEGLDRPQDPAPRLARARRRDLRPDAARSRPTGPSDDLLPHRPLRRRHPARPRQASAPRSSANCTPDRGHRRRPSRRRPPTRAEAELAALTELGDPVRLAAGYTDRPLHLIGPGVYPSGSASCGCCSSTSCRLVTGNLVARLFVDDVATGGRRPGGGRGPVGSVLMVALNVVFWGDRRVRPRRAVRSTRRRVDSWTPDQLPDDDRGRPGRAPARPWPPVGFLVARRPRDRLAADQLARGPPCRLRPGARPGALVRGAALAPARARRAGRRGGARPPPRPLEHRPPRPRTRARPRVRAAGAAPAVAGRPVQPGLRDGARRGRVGRRRRDLTRRRPSGSWSSWSGAWSRPCRTCAAPQPADGASGERAPTTSRNVAVCRSTSARVVSGHIRAMLWKGVIRMPRLHIARCR